MMQSLLADRFKLAVHYETKQMPVLALELEKAGELGPGLRPHSPDVPCPQMPVLPRRRHLLMEAFPQFAASSSKQREEKAKILQAGHETYRCQ